MTTYLFSLDDWYRVNYSTIDALKREILNLAFITFDYDKLVTNLSHYFLWSPSMQCLNFVNSGYQNPVGFGPVTSEKAFEGELVLPEKGSESFILLIPQKIRPEPSFK